MSCVAIDPTPLDWESSRQYLAVYRENYQLQQLIASWFEGKALPQMNCDEGDSFEPFIFTWISFNAWGTCVTEENDDSKIVERLAQNAVLREDFRRLLHTSPAFRDIASAFAREWPIFKLKSLREARFRVRYENYHIRTARICDYLY